MEAPSDQDRQTKWARIAPPLGLDPDDKLPLDPYLLWAVVADYFGYIDAQGDVTLPVLIEFRTPLRPDTAPENLDPELKDSRPWKALQSSLSWGYFSRYQTATVPGSALPLLIQLLRSRWVTRFQLGAARGRPLSAPIQFHLLSSQSESIQTVGVIDDGCCFAHGSFRGEGQTSRFAFIWDQNPRQPATAQAPYIWQWYIGGAGMPAPQYGTELVRSTIEDLLSKHRDLGEEPESALYRSIDRDWGQPDRIHGACVLHVFAGPATFLPPAQHDPGSASTLPIIFVQLPDQTAADTSGGSIGFYVLDGVRYIVQRTSEMCSPGGTWSTTINVSLGSLGGPHDGSSIVEKALDEIVDKYPGAVRIVMAAGNAARSRTHAVREVRPGAPGRFDVMVPPDNERESFVELWPQLADRDAIDQLQVSVYAPDGSELHDAQVGSVHVLRNPQDVVFASLIFPRQVAQGLNGPMILLATRPTESLATPDATAPSGAWTIVVKSRLGPPVTVHAWIERNDTVIGRRKAQRTVFIDDVAPGEDGGYLSNDSTLSSLAHGSNTTCVGAYEIDRELVSDRSSRGPVLGQAQVRPGVYGASDVSASLPGIACPGFFTGTRARLSGTSAAAPRVARWIAEGRDADKLVPLDPAQSTSAAQPTPLGVLYVREVDDLG